LRPLKIPQGRRNFDSGGDGKKLFQFDSENIGERWLSPLGWVELYNKEGINIGHFESSRLRIYPGCSVRHKVDLTDVAKGRHKVF
ncbi:MAG: hypothetical protein Q7U68_07855, partial [Candidatus Roizmanbacteria bacterium]|nr:hypothetical protein [Candidatus Roizmanbacteria bacterium]